MNALKWYTHKLTIMPIGTKCLTSFFIQGCGDQICQYIERYQDKNKRINFIRTLRQASFGFIMAPYFHFQFCVFLPYLFPENTKYRAFKMILLDQTIATTLFHTAYFVFLDYASGKSFNQISNCITQKVSTAVTSSWRFWPFIQLFNFTYVPIQFRVQFSNLFGIFWGAYLSYVQNVKEFH
jgi:protein Mpv17